MRYGLRAFTSVEYSRSLAALSCGHRRRATRGAGPCAAALRAARAHPARGGGRDAAMGPLARRECRSSRCGTPAVGTDRLSHRPRIDQPHPRLLRRAHPDTAHRPGRSRSSLGGGLRRTSIGPKAICSPRPNPCLSPRRAEAGAAYRTVAGEVHTIDRSISMPGSCFPITCIA
jgi:hypothetical protein